MKGENSSRYLTIYEQVKNDIIKGRYKKGTKLPSKRVMAEANGVSVITISHAYELLIDEGYVSPVEKSGFFVIFNEKEIYTGKAVAGENNLKETGLKAAESKGNVSAKNASKKSEMSLKKSEMLANKGEKAMTDAVNYSFSSSIYSKTARKVLSDMGDELLVRSPMRGTDNLREAIAEYLDRSRRISVETEQIFIGAGAEYLYGLIVQTFGREVLYGVESPSYQTIAKVYEAGGAKLDMLKLGKDGIESDELWSSDAKVLHITPYRSFPSGVTASASKKREYLKWANEKDAIVVEDDFESEFTPSRKPEETLFSLDENGHVIYVNTFSKTIGGAVRAAYMVVPKNLLDKFDEAVGFYACPVPTLEQNIIASLLNNGDFERHINRVRRQRRELRDRKKK